MEAVLIDPWAANPEPVLPDLATWFVRLEAPVVDAAARGMSMPEYACAQWLRFRPRRPAARGHARLAGRDGGYRA